MLHWTTISGGPKTGTGREGNVKTAKLTSGDSRAVTIYGMYQLILSTALRQNDWRCSQQWDRYPIVKAKGAAWIWFCLYFGTFRNINDSWYVCTSILEQHNSCKIHLSEPEMVFASHVGRITPRIKSNRYLCNHHSAKRPPGVQSADNGCQMSPCLSFKSQAGSELRRRSQNPKCCSDPSPSVELRQNWWVGPLPGSWPALRPKSLPYFVAQCLGQGPNK